ncbi:MAG: hypothetical protein EBZ83_07120, partial [Verrucomicrobia bacterium]|nr:hypothetical protein [Verrucomicrobiota bacterium]NDF17782.1 hypothetical protein [Verrucomicrobiota bacterium]
MAVIVARPDLNFWERLYLPSIVGGMLITLRHMAQTLWRMVFPRRHVAQPGILEMSATGLMTMQYPE